MKKTSRPLRPDSEAYLWSFLILAIFLLLPTGVRQLRAISPTSDASRQDDWEIVWGRGEEGGVRLYRVRERPPGFLRPDDTMPEHLKIFFNLPMDINGISAALLQTVPGIGRVLAHRIVQERSASGPFRNLEELRRVRGISNGKLQSLRPFLTAVNQTSS
jgi:hypothetical protein